MITRTCLTLMLALSLSGCAMRGWLFPAQPVPCAISPTISKDHLVQHLNSNIQGSATASGIASWRSTNVKITATGMPLGISVPASIAVEAPRNFRLRVSEPISRVEALDMGSNSDQFWFWAKDAQPQHVVTVSHQNMPAARRELRVPFDPDWLMEVLGVIPLDASKFTMQRTRTDAPTLELIAEELSPAGEATKRVVRVDACSGHIREHALYDGRGILIARAALADHRIDPPTGLVIPHVISFHWPAMNQSMTLTMGAVQLNPSQTPASVWEVPHKPGAPQFDLSQMLGGRSRAFPAMHGVRSPFGIMPPPDDHALQDSPFTHPEPQQAKADPEIIQTTFEEGAWWDEPATTDGNPATPQSGVSRQHLTRRNTNAFASEPL